MSEKKPPRQVYEDLKKTNPVLAARYAAANGVHDAPAPTTTTTTETKPARTVHVGADATSVDVAALEELDKTNPILAARARAAAGITIGDTDNPSDGRARFEAMRGGGK